MSVNDLSFWKDRAEVAEARLQEMQKEVDLLRHDEVSYKSVVAHLTARAEAAEAKVKELEQRWQRRKAQIDTALREREELWRWKRQAEARIKELERQAIADFGQIQTALEERDEARKALEPFAKAAEGWNSKVYLDTDTCCQGAFTVGDLRRARAALGDKP